ncbi:MAG: MlaD protein, partial [Planctomycetota bacterium]
MTPRAGAMSTELKVGLLFFIGLGLLLWFTLFVTRVGSAKGDFEVHFPQVSRLKEGDAVTYNGVKVGAVTAVAPDLIDGLPRVRVAFSIESRYKDKVLVGAGTVVRIQLPPLGGATLDLVSATGAPITPETSRTLAGQAPVGLDDAIASVRTLVEENRAEIRRAVTAVGDGMDRFGKMSEEVRALIEENRPAVKLAVANVGDAAGEIRAAVAENRQDL